MTANRNEERRVIQKRTTKFNELIESMLLNNPNQGKKKKGNFISRLFGGGSMSQAEKD